MTTAMQQPRFALKQATSPHPRLALTDAPVAVQLTEKYRPYRLADLHGQGWAVHRLTCYAEQPYPTAFLLTGDTGTGKTSAALALAHELDIDPDWSLHRIASGTMDAEAVESAIRSLRYSAPGGGFRMALADEADLMSPKAQHLWLSALEDLPPRAVVVFTTNAPGRLPQRFRDRCETIPFGSDADLLMQDAQTLADRVWAGERLPGKAPAVGSLPGIIESGAISFRRVVQSLQSARFAIPTPTRTSRAIPDGPVKLASAPVSASVAERRHNAAVKSHITRRANALARKGA